MGYYELWVGFPAKKENGFLKKIIQKSREKNNAKISWKKTEIMRKNTKILQKSKRFFFVFGWTYADGQTFRKLAREIYFSSSNIY